MGFTQGKEYAELEWPTDILITLVWVAYAVVFFGALAIRRVKHIYVANWFYGAFIITVAVLHIFNNLSVPIRCPRFQRSESKFRMRVWAYASPLRVAL